MKDQLLKQNKSIDYQPQTSDVKHFYQKADSVYAFINRLYQADGRMRFRGAPFMKEPPAELSEQGTESIADHMWATNVMWMTTYPILPHMAETISVSDISSLITLHDIGEIGDGDISAYLQLQGVGKDRQVHEFEVFTALTEVLPDESNKALNALHERYEREKNDPQTKDKEVLLAKIFDTLQGDHFVLTQHTDFSIEPQSHVRIITQKLLPYASHLRDLFLQESNHTAAEELSMLLSHHLYQYQKLDVVIPSDFSLGL